jgi:hypothetical protein
MSDSEYDEFVVCPTCGYIKRPDEGVEDAHLQPCPGERCGFALMLVCMEWCEDGDCEVSARWNAGEGAQLYLEDLQKALRHVTEFVRNEEAEGERIESSLDAIRRERQEQS